MYFLEREGFTLFTSIGRILSFIVVFRYLYLLFLNQRQILLTSFYQLYYMVGLLISAAVVSGGAYMIEVGAYGTANGFFWVTLAYFFAGIEATCFGFKSLGGAAFERKIVALRWERSRLLILTICSAAIAAALYVLATAGSPLLLGIDRVTFWRINAPQYMSFVPTLVLQTYFLVSYFYLQSIRKRRNTLVPILMILGYVFVTIFCLGQKFSAFIIFFDAWLMILSGTSPNFRLKISHVVTALTIFVGIIAIIALFYILSGRGASFIFSRIALQAQLPWSIFDDPHGVRLIPGAEWICYFRCGWHTNGVDYISYLYLPMVRYKFYYEHGSTLSGFMPALSLSTFGFPVSFLLNVFACFALGVLQRNICYAVRRDNVIVALLLFKMQSGLALAWFAASLTALLSIATAFVLLLGYFLISGFSRQAFSRLHLPNAHKR